MTKHLQPCVVVTKLIGKIIRNCLDTKGLAGRHKLSQASGASGPNSSKLSVHSSLETVHASGHRTEGSWAMHSDRNGLTKEFQSFGHSRLVCGRRRIAFCGLPINACADVLELHGAEHITKRPGVTA